MFKYIFMGLIFATSIGEGQCHSKEEECQEGCDARHSAELRMCMEAEGEKYYNIFSNKSECTAPSGRIFHFCSKYCEKTYSK
jgi:hypothetical protein